MATDLSSFTARLENASKALKISQEELQKILTANGIEESDEGLRYLNSKIATLEVLESILQPSFNAGVLQIKAAAMFLKGEDPFEETNTNKKQEVPVSTNSSTDVLIKYLDANTPIPNLKDRQLLELWAADRDPEAEQELIRRSKGQHFIVLKPGKYDAGKEEIDIEQSLELLKSTRKRTNPSIMPGDNDTYVSIYKVTELNMDDRIIEICPICDEFLFKGYCSKCESNFSGIGDNERAYVKLIVDSGEFNVSSFSDRKALLVSAGKGLDDLKNIWRKIRKEFDELKATGDLPKLRRIMDRPAQQKMDPFKVAGNRSF